MGKEAVVRIYNGIFSSVQFSSVAQSCPTLCDPMDRSMPGLPVHHQLPELAQTQSITSVMPSNHLILCHPFFSCSQSFPASGSFPMCQLFTSGGQILVLQLQHWSIHLSFPFQLKVTFLGKTSLTSSPTLL